MTNLQELAIAVWAFVASANLVLAFFMMHLAYKVGSEVLMNTFFSFALICTAFIAVLIHLPEAERCEN